jgi:hypothetical protein
MANPALWRRFSVKKIKLPTGRYSFLLITAYLLSKLVIRQIQEFKKAPQNFKLSCLAGRMVCLTARAVCLQKWRASYLNIGNLAPGEFKLIQGNVRLLQIPKINEHE